MAHRFSFECVDRTLRDILSVTESSNAMKPFGGKPILLGGDFDGNKSLYLVFVGVIFSQHLGLLLEQLGQHLGLLLEQDSSILTAFRTTVSI
jgi:hypothetical protein